MNEIVNGARVPGRSSLPSSESQAPLRHHRWPAHCGQHARRARETSFCSRLRRRVKSAPIQPPSGEAYVYFTIGFSTRDGLNGKKFLNLAGEYFAGFGMGVNRPRGQARHTANLGRADPASQSQRRRVTMSALLQKMSDKALKLSIPLGVQLDLTYRCNERCVSCYLDHDDLGEMTTAEFKPLLDEMAEAGVFILTLSGGEIFLRKDRDFLDLLEPARRLMICVKLKTNALLSRERGAARLRELSIQSVPISIYSHRPEFTMHHADSGFAQALSRCDPLSQVSGSEGHHGQCSDDPEPAGLSRRSRPRRGNAGPAKRRGQRRSSESESEESRADASAPRLRSKCIGERFGVIWSHLHRSNRTHARN
jgi:Radical SAM superfamily